MTPLGIELPTFRIVAQCPTQSPPLRRRVTVPVTVKMEAVRPSETVTPIEQTNIPFGRNYTDVTVHTTFVLPEDSRTGTEHVGKWNTYISATDTFCCVNYAGLFNKL